MTALALAGCAPRAARVNPALWLVEGPLGERAWLLGTIHALPRPVDWRTAPIERALRSADSLVLEVARIDDNAGMAKIFAALAKGSGQPVLSERLPPELRGALRRKLAEDAITPGSLDSYDTWAAALIIEQVESRIDRQDPANGIDRALAASFRGRIIEFEGAPAQLAIFDRLPETDQRALLIAALKAGPSHTEQSRMLAEAWARGDINQIATVAEANFAGQPGLRRALLVERNQSWINRLLALMAAGSRPFVAVGAAHMAGADGLPALLTTRGFKVTRIE